MEERQRPFVLTRSCFFGTQKYAAKWTGDNRATPEEVQISMNQLLTLGITGINFVGVDIPGFYGNATDDLFVKFYQLGAFFPDAPSRALVLARDGSEGDQGGNLHALRPDSLLVYAVLYGFHRGHTDTQTHPL